MSKGEVQDIVKAWLVISVAFAIAMNGFSVSIDFLGVIAIAAITVGLGFLLHELGHRAFARMYGCRAYFKANDSMLFLALIISFFGVVFAAPGAVVIHGRVTRKENGIISAMGPLANIVLALIFLGLGFLSADKIVLMVSHYGVLINAWLGLFNMIPVSIFDGKKVFNWSKTVYFSIVIVSAVLVFLSWVPLR